MVAPTLQERTQDISQVISDRFEGLTKSEKEIANFIRKNPEESGFLSAGEIARQLGLSEATMVRFARSMGFTSYPAMRVELQEAFRRRVTHATRLRGKLDEMRAEGDIFEQLTASEIDYLTQALETVDRRAFIKAVDLMRQRERIFVFGVGPSISLVSLMEIRLTRFGKLVIPLKATGREVVDPLLSMTKKDVVFAIGFFDLSAALDLVLEHAKQVDCPAILLTDTLGSVIGDKADVVLSARRGPMAEFHSLVVPMTIINALLLSVARQNQEQVLANLDKLDQLRDQFKKTSRVIA
jgi:DNA-binding MurR/RpiR family transcriptional regulator